MNDNSLMDIALSQYLNFKCAYCDTIYKDLKTLRKVNPYRINDVKVFKLACEECYKKEKTNENT